MTDIFLYQGEANPNDIKLRDPTTSGGPATPVPQGWLGQLSQAPRIVALPIAAALTWCPQPITPAVAAAPSLGWQGPLSVAPPIVQVARCFSFVPFDTVQPVAVTLTTGWQSPLSTAPKLASVPYNQTQLVPRDNPLVTLGWQAPLSIAPARAIIQSSSLTFVVPPFEVPRGWQSQLSVTPPSLAKARDTNQAFPYYPAVTVPDNTVTLDKWQRPLSNAPPVVQAPQSFSYVPFDTVQIVTQVSSYGWQQPLSVAPPIVKASQSFAFVPFDTPQVVVSSYGWQSALSIAPQVARAVYTSLSFVPLPFPQVNWGWQQPLGQAVKSSSVVPSQWTFVNVPVDVPRGWYQALSVAPLAVKAPQGFAFVPNDTPQIAAQVVSIAWQQPLSAAPRPASASQGFAFVPFDTAQATPVSIAGMAWFTQLGTAPSVPVALRGLSFVPFDTAQVPTPPDNSGQWSGKPRSGIHSGKSRSWKPLKLKKKTEEEELEELIEELRELARLSPKQVPAAAPAVLATYPRPLAEALFDLEKKQSATSLKATISRAQIEAEHALRIKRQQEEDDDDAAFLLLM